jgi:hypothetical protein
MSVDEYASIEALPRPGGWGTCRLAAMRFLTTAPGFLPAVARGWVNATTMCVRALLDAATNVADVTSMPAAVIPKGYSPIEK